jgi:glycine/D-amino acid oxidase-like deaminating enzyme/nitrite reductase/ring-hydroxylating ferredoxin subunit
MITTEKREVTMSTESIWQTFAGNTDFPSLVGDRNVDVTVIGGGITGLTTAQLLSEQGLSVVLIEAIKVGIVNSGHSTGNLYETMGEDLELIQKKFGTEITQQVVASRREAVNFIEQNVQRFGIDCDFARVPWFSYSTISERDAKIDEEKKLAVELGFPLEYADVPIPSMNVRKAVRLDRQAQFNPLRYCQGLARAIQNERCEIFEGTRVFDVDEKEGHCEVKTEHGKITSRYVVHATHTPLGIMSYHVLMGPYREYGIACRINNPQHPPGIYSGWFDKESTISTRTYQRDGESFLIVSGKPHKVGQGDSNRHIRMLEAFAMKFFNVIEVTHRWGAQHYRPADGLPYIGRRSLGSRTYVATGYSNHGPTFGTVAAKIICDQIKGLKSPYEDIYSAQRFTPMKSAPKFIKENANVAFEYVRDHLRRDHGIFADIAEGEGRVLDHEGQKLAVYRDESEGLQICSAVCPHMGCVVHWNNDERSWDCPCHGSRFNTSGEVLEGPTLHALASVDLTEQKTKRRKPLSTPGEDLQTGLGL